MLNRIIAREFTSVSCSPMIVSMRLRHVYSGYLIERVTAQQLSQRSSLSDN